ncbi:helix-turn-helix transcriptional regulator [Saccharothrix sp. 6-C]|uniref:winged helix-turn-helix transcriptional regulator n=1 Tax=Saccharothrix sp. 6-C TaxID=2781735 RepID=UPI00191784D0|nr:helix-turn-helix domain-containing protein [Saccharothrix sp. 6-C]QQQ74813.1 helix-turn-helix transcriptional regulator [Saccharothrix sp. 6-C]
MSLVPVPVTTADRAACPVSDLLSRVGDKWSLLVLALLAERSYGFNELDRAVHGLSRRILTRTLRALERDGLVSREERPGKAAGVTYAATALGRSMLDLVVPLGQWVLRHEDEIEAARSAYDNAASTRRAVSALD